MQKLFSVKSRILLLLIFMQAAVVSQAQSTVNLDAALIPKELLPYASAVVRYSFETVEVKDISTTVFRTKKAITVLNKNGDRYGAVSIWYNKIFSLKSVKGVVYNADGKPIGKFSERDFEDSNAGSGSNLFEDSRQKDYAPAVINYPYTVEYELEMRSRQTLYLDSWSPSIGAGVAVEKSSFIVTSKPDFNIRFKEFNMPGKINQGDNDGLKTYSWSVENLKAFRREPYGPDADKFLPMVKLTPEKFTYDGVSGSFANWSELGKWMYDKLLAGRDVLPQSTVDQVKELTENIADPKEKARKVYEFMQQKTRYISVQVGIGGIRPFPATEVDQVNYGDCKALVNYTQALLKAAGIPSYYCLVYGDMRKRSLMPQFTSMQGNHVILCIPFKNDTTWLECTSQKIPFGFLGDFTDDRWALACTPEGGKLMHTPRYTAANNLTKRQGKFVIDKEGALSGDMKTVFNGTEYDARYRILDEPYKEQVKGIQEVYHINNLDVEKMSFTKRLTAMPATTEQIDLRARDFATTNSGKFYFKVNLANALNSVPDEVRTRNTEVYINRGYIDEDEISYTLPEGYRPDKLLLNRSIDKPFGKFTVTMQQNGNELVYRRRLQINDGTYSKDIYQDLVNFYQAIADVDSYTAAFKKD